MVKILQTLSSLDLRKKNGETTGWREVVYAAANALLFISALCALVVLTAQHGFYLSEQIQKIVEQLSFLILVGFIFQALMKLSVVSKRMHFLRQRWIEYLLVGVMSVYVIFPGPIESFLVFINPQLTPATVTGIYISISQILVALALFPSSLRASRTIMSKNVQPSFLLLLSFLVLIAFGTGLLLLPKATVSQSMTVVDALFTATSAVCVTGLIVVDTNSFFTSLGHHAILLLIQVGGLGIMTLTTFFAFVLGRSGNIKEYSTMQSLLGEEGLGRIKQTLAVIALATAAIEIIGALLLYYAINGTVIESYHPWYFSVFHSISAFCNAGFTLTTENLMHPALQKNWFLLVTIAVLVIFGGIGFPVFVNILTVSKNALLRRNTVLRLSLHTKLVLVTSILLLLVGTLGLFLLDTPQVSGDESITERWIIAFFHSTIARTAGFNSVEIAALTPPALFLLMLLMWIGASPASTGGGIKTTTFAVALLNLRSIATGKARVEVFRKQIPAYVSTKAFTTVLLSLFFMTMALFILLLTENQPFELLLFEVISAMSTVGLSAGITTQLSTEGKYVIIATMIIGRIGFLAFLLALIPKQKQAEYEHITEEVLIT